ncbi:hypothetical protein L7F22_014587 [Adiantum nelumboides]|nr:hypothetical protein [Adiantum nelumboides]
MNTLMALQEELQIEKLQRQLLVSGFMSQTAQHEARVKQLEHELAQAKAELELQKKHNEALNKEKEAVGSLVSTSQISQAKIHVHVQLPPMPYLPDLPGTSHHYKEHQGPAPGALDVRGDLEQEIEDMPKGPAKEFLLHKKKVTESAALAFLLLEEQCHEQHRVWSHDSFDACPKCTSACNSESSMPFFFKYVVVSMESSYYRPSMEVPFDFAKAYISDSVCHVELEGPHHRQLYIIKVKHQPKECILAQGWKDFAANHELARGDLLLFQLMSSLDHSKHRHFLVKIFKQNPLVTAKSYRANPPPNLLPHKDKRHKIDMTVECGSLHKELPAEKEAKKSLGVSNPKPTIEENSANVLMLEEDTKLTVNAFQQGKIDMEFNTDMHDLANKERKQAKTCSNKSEPDVDSPSKNQKNEVETSFEHGKNCENLDAELNGSALKHSEASTTYKQDKPTPTMDSVDLVQRNKTQHHKCSTNKCQPSVYSSSEKQKRNLNRPEAVSPANTYVRRKTAVEAMAKIASCYSMKSSNNYVITKPSLKPVVDTYVERKAALKAIAKINQYKSVMRKEDRDLKENQKASGKRQDPQVHRSFHQQLTFSKIMHLTSVTTPFLLHIPRSFVKDFLKQTNAEPCFTFTLMLEQAYAKATEGTQVVAAQSWLGYGVLNAIGAMTMTRGWREFACANDLQVGDVCIFKLVKPFSFMIHVVRRGENPHPEATEECIVVDALPTPQLMQSTDLPHSPKSIPKSLRSAFEAKLEPCSIAEAWTE